MPVRRINYDETYMKPLECGFFPEKKAGMGGLLITPTPEEKHGMFISDDQLASLGYQYIGDGDPTVALVDQVSPEYEK